MHVHMWKGKHRKGKERKGGVSGRVGWWMDEGSCEEEEASWIDSAVSYNRNHEIGKGEGRGMVGGRNGI